MNYCTSVNIYINVLFKDKRFYSDSNQQHHTIRTFFSHSGYCPRISYWFAGLISRLSTISLNALHSEETQDAILTVFPAPS